MSYKKTARISMKTIRAVFDHVRSGFTAILIHVICKFIIGKINADAIE